MRVERDCLAFYTAAGFWTMLATYAVLTVLLILVTSTRSFTAMAPVPEVGTLAATRIGRVCLVVIVTPGGAGGGGGGAGAEVWASRSTRTS